MSAENEAVAPAPEAPKRRGRPPRATEAPQEKSVDVDALRAEMEASIRAELAEEAAKEKREADLIREAQSEAKPIQAGDVDGDPSEEGSLTVHFVEDGLTLLGKVWYRGEELTVNPGTAQWEDAHKVLQLDEYAQESRWGRRMFRPGPWRGKPITEAADAETTEAERAALSRAQISRDSRYASR